MQSFSKDTSLVEVNQAIKAWSFYITDRYMGEEGGEELY